MQYLSFIEQLKSYAEEDFACFQRRLIPTKQKILGVRTPIMRKIAKSLRDNVGKLMAFPDEYFEVTFIKLTAVSSLSYEQFISYLPSCVEKIDNWATCDSFKAKCILKNRQAFLPVLENIFARRKEFYQRYALVSLLFYYVDKEYLPLIKTCLQRADTSSYYVYMAAAWLAAEVLIKHYEYGLQILNERVLDPKTHNKAIQKAIESYRLTKEQKETLRFLKIKK